MKCIQCNKEFESKRSDAKFDTDACRKKYVRDNVKADISYNKTDKLTDKADKVSEINVRDNSFTPNWQGKYDSPQHAIEGALKALEINRKAILKHGVSETTEFILGDKIFTLNERGFVKR